MPEHACSRLPSVRLDCPYLDQGQVRYAMLMVGGRVCLLNPLLLQSPFQPSFDGLFQAQFRNRRRRDCDFRAPSRVPSPQTVTLGMPGKTIEGFSLIHAVPPRAEPTDCPFPPKLPRDTRYEGVQGD